MIQQVDKAAVARAFGRAAGSYVSSAQLQREVGERLIELSPQPTGLQTLDAGCGTGYFSRYWRQQGHSVLALDLAPSMLAEARRNQAADAYLQADIECLPLQDKIVDLAFSNLALQWCGDLQQALRELYRVVRPGGKILFSTLSSGTLAELRFAFQQLDSEHHVNRFFSTDMIEQTMQKVAGQHYQIALREHCLQYQQLWDLLLDLKQVGATHLHEGRRGGLRGRQWLRSLEQAYPRGEKGFPLTYQCVYGIIDVR